MRALPPVPEPDDSGQPEWLSVVSGYILSGPVIDTPIDSPADLVCFGPDGMITLIQVKRSVQPKLNPGDRWTRAIEEWSSARRDGRLENWGKLPADSLDEQAAQNATAAAFAMMFSVAVFEGASPGQVFNAASRLECLLGDPEREAARSKSADLDTQYVASWLDPTESRVWRLQAQPVGTAAHSRQISAESFEQQLIILLSHWCDVAQEEVTGRFDAATFTQHSGRINRLRAEEVLCAVGAAKQASTAALEARMAILTQPSSTSMETVARFAADWLNLQPTQGLVEATSNALLFASLDDLDPSDESLNTDELRKDVVRRHRTSRPIGETQLCGLLVDYLQRPVGVTQPGVVGCSVGDNVAGPWSIEDVVLDRVGGWHDPRVGRVLCQLQPEELRVAIAYGDGRTWAEAALSCGMPEQYGERVRRKLRRLGAQLLDRGGGRSAA